MQKKIFFRLMIFFYSESPNSDIKKVFQSMFDWVIFSKESLGIHDFCWFLTVLCSRDPSPPPTESPAISTRGVPAPIVVPQAQAQLPVNDK